MMDGTTYPAGRFLVGQAPLDRDSWEEDKEGMEFNEAPPESPDFNLEIPTNELSDWALVFRYLAIALLAGFLIYLVVRLIMRRQSASAKSESNAAERDVTDEEPNALAPLEELWAAYAEAKNNQNYPEALRFLYQIAINHLDSLGKLKAGKDKTNREYLGEMSWPEKSQDFFRLTILHETTWYGAKEVNQAEFGRAEPQFLAFIESIKNG